VSDERLRGLTYAEAEAPAFAPDVAIEILSPEDRPARLAAKLRVYLACGTRLVAIVDPRHRTVRLVDHANDRTIGEPGRFAHEAMPGFALDLTTLFRALDLPANARGAPPSIVDDAGEHLRAKRRERRVVAVPVIDHEGERHGAVTAR